MLRVGTCGFSFKGWKGIVYPDKLKDRDMLDYYSRVLGFDTVEIDASYYTLISEKTSARWAAETGENFLFAVKCHKDITLNSRTPVDPAESFNQGLVERFIEGFRPLIRSGKILTFLAQFGPVFFNNTKNRDYILKIKESFNELPLTVEFRHSSWLSQESRENTFDFLKKNKMGYAVVDEPALRSLVPLVAENTHSTGYVRFHGRNPKWFQGDSHTRYDYLYSDDELTEFIPFIRGLESRTAITSVFFNNCHAGAALKNAIKLRQMLNLIPSYEKTQKTGQLEMEFD